MPLLEKAYAKLDQNYDRIIGGFGIEGLRTLTGMPTVWMKHDLSKKGTVEPFHRFFAKHHYPMTAACCRGGGADGLISGHAYTLLDVVDLVDGRGRVKHTLAKMRNPWGSESYHGQWSDNDASWTREWRKQVGLVKANDGVFYMPYDNFLNYYEWIAAAMIKAREHKAITLQAKGWNNVIRMHNPTNQYLFVSADIYSPRNYPRNARCKPNDNIVLYFRNKDGSNVGDAYAGLWQVGTKSLGKFKEKTPAGDYVIKVVNQNDGKADVTVNVYWGNADGAPTFDH